VDGERDHDNMAGKSLEMASPAEALAALGWAADAKGCGRGHIADLGASSIRSAVSGSIWEGNPARSQSKWPLVTRLLGEPLPGRRLWSTDWDTPEAI
jgi:hypothetical protein